METNRIQINDRDIIVCLAALRTTAALMDVVKIPVPGLMVESNRSAYTETAAKFEEIARMRDEMRHAEAVKKTDAKTPPPPPAKVEKKGRKSSPAPKIVTKGTRRDYPGSP